MDVILSIKPQYVEKIISHEKKYEFRKQAFKKEIENIIIYSTAPEKKIVGYFKLDKIIKDTPTNLWKNFKENAGIPKKDFFKYFEGKEKGYALKVGELTIWDNYIDTNNLKDFKPPQLYEYVDMNEVKNLK